MTRDDIQAVMDKVPQLGVLGLGVRDRDPTRFDAERMALLDEVEGCTLTEGWVKYLAKTRAFNTRHTSYGLKHVVERKVGYCTNGAFIAAMIHCGFRFKQCSEGSRNAWFAFSEQSLQAIVHRLDPEHRDMAFRVTPATNGWCDHDIVSPP
jgi:hypothetical protein